MPEIVLGLDVGSQNIKAVLIKRGKKNRVVDAAVARTPDGSVVEGELAYLDAVADILNGFIVKSGVKPTSLATCVNSPNIITRNLTLPPLAAEETASAVRFEILKLFPSIKDTHIIAQRTVASDASSTSALAALCPVESLQIYKELSARLGLELKCAGVREDAQTKAVALLGINAEAGGKSVGAKGENRESGKSVGAKEKNGEPGKSVGAKGENGESGKSEGGSDAGLLIDVGYRSSRVGVVSRGKLALSRYVMSGAAAFDRMAAEKLGVPEEDLENARLSGDYSNVALDPNDAESIRTLCFLDIEEQIRQTFDFYEDDKSGGGLKYITVVGEGAAIPGISEYFAQAYALENRSFILNEKSVSGAEVIEKTGNPALLLAAVGCTLGDFAGAELNFIPQAGASSARRVKTAAIRRLAPIGAAVALVAIVSFTVTMYYYTLDRQNHLEIDSINDEILNDYQVSEQSGAISNAENKLSGIISVINAIDTGGARASEILEDLTASAPENLFAVNLNVQDTDSFVVSGRSKDYESISQFALKLRQSGKYDGVRINSITANQTASDIPVDYSFILTIAARQVGKE